MFSAFYVRSKALTINNDDFTAGRPNGSAAEVRRADSSSAAQDRPQNFVVNFVYQTPKAASGALGVLANAWQISGIYRWTTGRPYAITYSIPGIGNAHLTGTSDFAARVKLPCAPRSDSSSAPYPPLNT